MSFSIIILAAGLGKRMNNPDVPKALTELNGMPLIHYVLNVAISLNPDKICIVVGHYKDKLVSYINDFIANEHQSLTIEYAIQEEQLGTGHAVQCCENNFANYGGKVLILSADVPILRAETLLGFIENSAKSNLSVLSSVATNPFGYGRILRDINENIIGIVEEKDATELERLIYEINTGIYFVDAKLLFSLIKKIKNNNNQAEYYLTDIVSIGLQENLNVIANTIAPFTEIQGVNTLEQLEEIKKIIVISKFYPTKLIPTSPKSLLNAEVNTE
ncbi:MAG: NTP transferase domain-containing protein [Bacteroidetes bacterium]|nr:NTP transferase domain-containing protein [Bacteroidota bacterium]